MNCRRVEKLIPLYVEGDLKSRVSDPVASHLEWCGRCNWLADEFRESQNWLRSSELPDFDEAFLDNFKADALKLIAETNSKPSLLSSLMQQWNRRQVFALSTAILIIAGVFVFYVYQAGTNARLQVAETTVTTEPEGTPAPEPQRAADKGHDSRMATGAASRAPHRMKTPTSAKERTDISLVPTQTIESSLPTQMSRLQGPGFASSEPASELPKSSDDLPPMLRIEMQTSDPNIRIIWFAPREVERPKTNQ